MKTVQLASGLALVAAVVGILYAGITGALYGAACVYALLGAVLAGVAANLLCKALLGDRGLVMDVARVAAFETALEERQLLPAARPPRVTHPSPALRDRGAKPEVRVPTSRA